ncbi:type II secretion system inner membrane protein GspF [Geobacter argillaceus]|uniref:General secretion pathway protein F n=1 Tax=Geobacter argillaceus TaxID=345631 RepID=A0A562WSA1_9BACT|nr:type II secretion system inner membrane protein GspF [Geobacter argillaceus]TWJ33465.1 general secretion pathway protein F [Geobacter argillaceus]
MPTFQYRAYRADGRETSGTVDSDSIRTARERLKQQGLLPIDLVPADEAPAKGLSRTFRSGVPVAELALFTRRLATLVSSAVPIHEALTALLEQERPGELRKVLGRVRDRLSEGAGLAKAMGREPRIFSESYVSMVAAGEASGALDQVLERLADFLEGQEVVRSKVTSALAYPILMVVVGSGVMLFLLAFVIPKITGVFADNKAALPLITVALIAVSNALRKGWWLILILVAAATFIYRRLAQKEEFRLKRDRLLLRLPFAGALVQKLVLSRFARVLGLLLASGVPVIRALEITGEAVVNRAYRVVLAEARLELAEGGKLSASLARSSVFPPLLVHMIAVGEKSGTLEGMLEKSGSAYEREFEASVGRFLALLEPLLVLAMGLAVGLVVVAVLLPIFQLNQLVK